MPGITFACNCGQSLRAPEESAGRRAACPKCGTMIRIPVPRERRGAKKDKNETGVHGAPDLPPASSKPIQPQSSEQETSPERRRTMRANRRYAGKVCSICQDHLQFGEQLRICEHCQLAFHQACWDQNKGCGTYGCPAGPQVTTGASAPPPLPAEHASLGARVQGKGRRLYWVGGALGIVLIGVAVLIYALEYVYLQEPMNEVLSSDPRNDGIEVRCGYGSWFSHGVLVYDLREVPLSKSQADVFRVFLQYAAKQSDSTFHTVELSYQGETKFVLAGDDFAVLGREYDTQNPVYTMRTFPEKLRKPNGARAFAAWSGGVLGVLKRQMEDFDAFHKQWYGFELLSNAGR